MQIKDENLNLILHELTKITTQLKKQGIDNIALQVEKVREEILLSIEEVT